jgi:hypothetical protein
MREVSSFDLNNKKSPNKMYLYCHPWGLWQSRQAF